MNVLVLMGSPRLGGNTAELCKPFIKRLKQGGAAVRYIELASLNINPCKGCYACQNVPDSYGCVQNDDMPADDIMWADVIVLATPIYAWYCAAPMKNLLDRHYGFNKYYGTAEESLWGGKRVAIIATHGYEGRYATEPFEMGIERLCKHSGLEYVGIYSVQDEDDLASFQTETAVNGAIAFADRLMKK